VRRQELAHLLVGQAAQPHRDRSRPDRRQQPARVHRRQEEQASARRLLQQLEQRVGRLLARLLGHQPLGVAQDEDAAAAFDRGQRRPAMQEPDGRHGVAGHALGRAIQRLGPPLLHDFRDCLGGLVHRLVRVGRLGAGHRDEPVQVRVGQAIHQAAAAAGPAGLRVPPLAEHELGEPEGQALLADPGRSRDHDHLRKPLGPQGLGEAAAVFEVPGERWQVHGTQGTERGGKR
jgi:hypothetical protein